MPGPAHASGTPGASVPGSAIPRQVLAGTAWQVLGRVAGSVATFLSLLILARALSGEEFGRFTFYLAVFGLLDALTDFGTGSVAVRRTAGDRWALIPVLRAARRLRLVLAGLGLGLTWALVLWFKEPGAAWIVAAALYPATHAWELSATIFKNQISWRVPTLVRSTAALLRLMAIAILAAAGVLTAAPFLFASALVSAGANAVLHWVARPHLPRPNQALRTASGIFRESWPLGVGMVCQQGYFYLDNLFVRAWLGAGALGHYNAAMRLLSAAIILALYAASSALPWLSERARANDVSAAAANLAQPLLLLAAGSCGLLAPWSSDILELCFGAEFKAASAALMWLFAAIATIHAGAVLLNALVASGRSQRVLWISLGALALNALLNALFVPRFGLAGAAATTLATEAAVALGAGFALAGPGPSPFAVRPLRWLAAPLVFVLLGALSWCLRQALVAQP